MAFPAEVKDSKLVGLPKPKTVSAADPPKFWEEENFESFEDAEEYYVRDLRTKWEESVDAFWKKKSRWARADKLVHLEHFFDELIERHPAKTRLPHLPQAMEEYLANRNQDIVRPQASSRQPEMDDIIGSLNYFKDVELDNNLWSLLSFRRTIDQLKYRIAFWRVDVDRHAIGPFGHRGRHVVTRVDPRCVWPDPLADSWRWEDMQYLIIAKVMDLSDIRRNWVRGHLVKADENLSFDTQKFSKGDKGNLRAVENSMRHPSGHMSGRRKRAMVLECYVKDYQTRQVDANEGTPLEGKMPPIHLRRYPNGRVFIIAGDILLHEGENPYPDGEPPIVEFLETPYDGLFSYSLVNLIDSVEKKWNMLAREAYMNMRTHLNNQWIIDRNAFTKPSQFESITQNPKQLFIVRPGSRIQRLPPGLMPPELFNFLGFFENIMDSLTGMAEVNRGGVQKGSQLAAEAIENLQGAGLGRMKLKQKMDSDGVKRVGKKLIGNIRKWYPAKLHINVRDPLKPDQPLNIAWDRDAFKNEWAMKIEAGSTAPGAKQSAMQQALQFHDRDIVDDLYVLQSAEVPDANAIIERKKQQNIELAKAGFLKEAFGKKGRRTGPRVKEPKI